VIYLFVNRFGISLQPSMIKRPVLDLGDGRTLLGFRPEVYAEALKG